MLLSYPGYANGANVYISAPKVSLDQATNMRLLWSACANVTKSKGPIRDPL